MPETTTALQPIARKLDAREFKSLKQRVAYIIADNNPYQLYELCKYAICAYQKNIGCSDQRAYDQTIDELSRLLNI